MSTDAYKPRTLIVTLTADVYRTPAARTSPGNHRLEFSASTVLAADEDEDRARDALARIVSRAALGGAR